MREQGVTRPAWYRVWTGANRILYQLAQLAEYDGLARMPAMRQFLHDRQMPPGIGAPEDVPQAGVFLVSPRARFITGAVLDIGDTVRGLI